MFKFKIGDKVRINAPYNFTGHNGIVGKVTQLGGTATPDKGAIVTSDAITGSLPEIYGEHGVWYPEKWLELVK